MNDKKKDFLQAVTVQEAGSHNNWSPADFYHRRQATFAQILRDKRIDLALFEDTEGRRDPAIRYFTGQPGDSLLLITAISAMIVLTITSNLALSLGMVGALSIVRFRTAIKDSVDTAFLFWAVAAGITAGAGFYQITLIGCLFIGAVCIVSVLLVGKCAKAYLLVVRADDAAATDRVEEALQKNQVQYKLSALTQTSDYAEGIYELAFSEKDKAAVTELKNISGVKTVSLVDCRKS